MSELPAGWSVATYPGTDGQGETCVAYRRYTLRDRLDARRWLAAWQTAEATLAREGHSGAAGEVEALAGLLGGEEQKAAAEAMAGRLLDWPAGEGWTDARLLSLRATRPALWSWLYGLLYWPALAELDGGTPERARLAAVLAVPPGDPSVLSRDCGLCLQVAHEEWRPEAGKLGRPVHDPERPGYWLQHEPARDLGDGICQQCERWDIEAGRPRQGLSVYHLGLVELLQDTRSTGQLPAAGGLLDQEAEQWELLGVIASSAWFRQIEVAGHAR